MISNGLGAASFDALAGFEADDALSAFRTFLSTARALELDAAPLRAGLAPSAALRAAARAALAEPPRDAETARRFFLAHFRPFRVGAGPDFLTGYYEPWARGSMVATPKFSAPVLARPADLVSFAPGRPPPGFDSTLAAARRSSDGTLSPYPDRAAIETRGDDPLLWLADPVEVFLIQVQGSARVELEDGRVVRLVYDGRNGQPYTSIGRTLIEAGEIPEREMSLARLKSWLREHGLRPGERGRELMWRNRSYVFFRVEENLDPEAGPIGGAGVPLTPLRSIAVDRSLWSYGLPFWISADLPWEGDAPTPFRRLMIAQDTGSAILGAARADLFFGGGDLAGTRAGAIRHHADFTVLLPLGDER
jgi:membrane-bound lytic murein transglycosylase A